MASCIVLLIPDLLFSSKLAANLTAANYQIKLCSDQSRAREWLAAAAAVIVDLSDPQLDLTRLIATVRECAPPPKTLGCYAHVLPEQRARALAAGFDLALPRSRVVRDSAAVVAQLLDSGSEQD